MCSREVRLEMGLQLLVLWVWNSPPSQINLYFTPFFETWHDKRTKHLNSGIFYVIFKFSARSAPISTRHKQLWRYETVWVYRAELNEVSDLSKGREDDEPSGLINIFLACCSADDLSKKAMSWIVKEVKTCFTTNTKSNRISFTIFTPQYIYCGFYHQLTS